MKTPKDVRLALYKAHKEQGLMGLNGCTLTVHWSSFKHPYDVEDIDKVHTLLFQTHFKEGETLIIRGDKTYQENESTWRAIDPCEKAIELIEEWAKEYQNL